MEIRVKLSKGTKQDQISVALSRDEICVNLVEIHRRTLIRGKFEHHVDTESAYWVIEEEGPYLAIFIDKAEEMWWNGLLENEEAAERGPRNFTVPMEHLDEGSRMVVDKLVTEQKKKLLSGSNADSLSPA